MAHRREPGQRLTVSFIPAATRKPVVSVKKEDSLDTARSKMMLNDFSQIPVLRGDRPRGVVSWESIGRVLMTDPNASLQACIDRTPPLVKTGDDLLDVIPLVNKHGYAVVITDSGAISGIVTGADLGDELAELVRPILRLESVEIAMRRIVKNLLDSDELSAASIEKTFPAGKEATVEAVDGYTFGQLVRIITNEVVWPSLRTNFDRLVIDKALQGAVQLRNRIMHFREHTPEDEETLRTLDQLAKIVEDIEKSSAV